VRWPQLRAGLIALAILFGLIDGCPLPSPSHTPAWERSFVPTIRSVRDVAETPVAWIRRVFAVTQQWSLYQAPIADRYRMWIEGRTKDTWQLVYRAGDPDHTEDASLIEHARVWGEWDPTDAPALEYREFAAWITSRVLEAHPEFSAARVRMERITIGHGSYTATNQFETPYERGRF
jgi:hypothetical protein